MSVVRGVHQCLSTHIAPSPVDFRRQISFRVADLSIKYPRLAALEMLIFHRIYEKISLPLPLPLARTSAR